MKNPTPQVPKPPRGRASKLTPELQTKIVKALEAGNYLETAAAAVGVHKQSLYTWMRKGNDKPDSPHGRFLDAVQRAWRKAELDDLACVTAAAAGYTVTKVRKTTHPNGDVEEVHEVTTKRDWQAAAWKLERRFPRRWGRWDRHEITGIDGGPIQVDVQRAEWAKIMADPKAVQLAEQLDDRMAQIEIVEVKMLPAADVGKRDGNNRPRTETNDEA